MFIFRLLGGLDWISQVSDLADDVQHGFSGTHVFVSIGDLKEAEEACRELDISFWSSGMYDPTMPKSSQASLTVRDEDYSRLTWRLAQKNIRVYK